MQDANLYKRAWTAPKLRTETCPIQYIILWITLTETQSWVYSTPVSQKLYVVMID